MQDFLPAQAAALQHVITTAERCARLYGYERIETPILEHASLFRRSLGDLTDVVMKEMYSFIDKNGEELCLRPENTAGAVRALISNGLTQTLPQRWFYAGPMFRRERPQKGRFRQFHQCGVELLGDASIEADAEVLACAWQFLEALGIADKVTLKINWLGSLEERTEHARVLREYFQREEVFSSLSEESQARVERNPLRILDSKDPRDEEAIKHIPKRFIDIEKLVYFYRFLWLYDIPCGQDFNLVRGLDYYNNFVFEFVETDNEKAQSAIIAGGRYDTLSETLGGHAVPAVGWAAGIERLVDLCTPAEKKRVKIYIILNADKVKKAANFPEEMEIFKEIEKKSIYFAEELKMFLSGDLRAKLAQSAFSGYRSLEFFKRALQSALFRFSTCNVQVFTIADQNIKKAMEKAAKENADYVIKFIFDIEKWKDYTRVKLHLRNMKSGEESSALTQQEFFNKIQETSIHHEFPEESLKASLDSIIEESHRDRA